DSLLAKGVLLDSFDDGVSLKEAASSRVGLSTEIVSLARRHDRELAADLTARIAKSESGNEILTRESSEHITERGALYLDSARGLLKDGDQAGAVSLAQGSLVEGRSNAFLWMVFELEQRAPAPADRAL